MKNPAILVILIFILSSCSKDDEIAENEFLGEWELVKTTGQFSGSERTGAEMDWQESYILRPNGTFTKKRVRENETYLAGGTYIIHHEENTYGQSGIASISMVYGFDNQIIATCYSDKLQEELYFSSDQLMESTWKQCDRLGLEYSKKENK